MNKTTVPQTPIKKRIDPFDQVVGHLVSYMELARATKFLLETTKRLTPPLDLRLTTEINFCHLTLTRVCNLSLEAILDIVKRLVSQPDFAEEVKSMANWLSPGRGRVLITPDEFGQELRTRPPLPSKSLFRR